MRFVEAGVREISLTPADASVRDGRVDPDAQIWAPASTNSVSVKRFFAASERARPRDPSEPASRRFAINVASNLCYLALNTGLMIWYVPFLVGHVGLAAYGMVALANSLIMYAAIVTNSLDTSIYRYLAIDLNQDNATAARQTFNCALALTVIALCLLLPAVGAVTYFFPALFNVPAELITASQFLFASVALMMLLGLVGSPFGVSSLIRHRFDLRNIVRSLMLLSRVGTVVACFAIWPASLWHVGSGFAIAALVGFAGDVLIWKTLAPQLVISRKGFDRDRFRALLHLSGWSTVNTIGFLLLMQVDLLIVNALFGAEMTGLYGALLLFPALIHTMVETVVPVLSPAIMARYAVEDREGLRRLAIRSVKLLGLGVALPVGLLCGFGGPLLSLWLGPNFAFADLVLMLLVGHLTVNLALRPLAYVLTAYNQIKVQGLLTLALGVVNVLLAIGLVRWSGWGLAAVPVATALVWTIRNAVFVSGYSAGVLGLRWWAFYPPLLPGAAGLLGVAAAGRLISQLWWPTNWLMLAAMAAAVIASYGLLAWTIGLDRSDRALLWSLARNKQG